MLEKCRGLKGNLLDNIARVRGAGIYEFLRECKHRLSASGKRMRYNLQLDFFRPDPPACRLLAYPANLHFEWRRWVDEGLMDEAVLRFYELPFKTIFEDKIAKHMIAACNRRNIPICVNRYLRGNGGAGENLPRRDRPRASRWAVLGVHLL